VTVVKWHGKGVYGAVSIPSVIQYVMCERFVKEGNDERNRLNSSDVVKEVDNISKDVTFWKPDSRLVRAFSSSRLQDTDASLRRVTSRRAVARMGKASFIHKLLEMERRWINGIGVVDDWVQHILRNGSAVCRWERVT
jgi:hypothetical protein